MGEAIASLEVANNSQVRHRLQLFVRIQLDQIKETQTLNLTQQLVNKLVQQQYQVLINS